MLVVEVWHFWSQAPKVDIFSFLSKYMGPARGERARPFLLVFSSQPLRKMSIDFGKYFPSECVRELVSVYRFAKPF